MGYYIQTPGVSKGKAAIIKKQFGADIIEQPKAFADVPENKALICVSDNGPFEAACWVHSLTEFAEFAGAHHKTPKIWLLAPKEAIKQYFRDEGCDGTPS